MSDTSRPIAERLLQRLARTLAGGVGVHPLQILTAVEEAALAASADGVVPNSVSIGLHPADYSRYRDVSAELRQSVSELLESLEQQVEGMRFGERLVTIAENHAVPEGEVRVSARFADTANRPREIAPGATRQLDRHRGTWLVLGDGSRIALTHTPFTLGRGPDNDLVLVSLAVSRRHARVVWTPDGFAMEDTGSRNGLLVGDVRWNRVLLGPGVAVRVGDIDIVLERAV